MTRLAVLPLDDRPVNYDYPEILGRMAGVEIVRPPREWLGNPWRESQHEDIIAWLESVAPTVDGLIAPIDTLAYGGLIRMRISHEPFEGVQARLAALARVKEQRPELKIVASSVIQRVSRDNSSEEEMPYWGEWGARMFRLSYLEHKSACGEASLGETAERDQLKAEIPAEVYDDYLGIRRRNTQVNHWMLDWVEKGVLDYLLLPQDDTADYGWNIAEARNLQAEIRRRGLTGRAITYPGADEIGCLLLTRWMCQQRGFKPRVFARFSSSLSNGVITSYEDRPMLELIKAHLAPLDGIVVEDPNQADIQLFVNAPALRQGVGDFQWIILNGLDEIRQTLPEALRPALDEMAADESFRITRREMQTPLRSPEEFTRAVCASVRSGAVTAVADVAYVNGADLIFGNQLMAHPEAAGLAAYGGWNTAGNTLGTVVAQAVLRALMLQGQPTRAQIAAHNEFLFLRFLDDYAYQALERTRCMVEDLPRYGIPPTNSRLPDEHLPAIQASVARRLQGQTQRLNQIFAAYGQVQSVEMNDLYLPWNRLFEIGCQIEAHLP